MMPIPAVSSEPGSLDAEHRPDRAGAHLGGQLLEPRAFHRTGTRAAEIVVDPRHRGEPGGARRFDQLVLSALAFGVLQHLRRGGLADINRSTAAEMLRRDLRVHRSSPSHRSSQIPGPGLRAEDRREPAPAPSIAAPAGPVVPGSAGVGVVVVTSVASSAASFSGRSDDDGAALSGNRLARTSDNSANASTRTCGGPNVIERQVAGSHIHIGSLREMCRSPSTRRTIPSRRSTERA